MPADTAHGVIATKLFVPSLRLQPVSRPRLSERLRAGVQVPLTLLVAPAGWGKSTLIAEWVRQSPATPGWVSLDRSDSDVKRFWLYLLLAANRCVADVAGAALRRLEAAGTDVLRDVLPVFVNDVAAQSAQVVLVLDDFHLVGGTQVHESIATLLDHCPAQLHLVVSTRSDPPLALSRLRLLGGLVEIRADQLRFTVDEAAELLDRALGEPLAAQDVERLVARTEGWAAGLQLAAIGLADRTDRAAFIERFTGADRHVVDYLGEEVLEHQSEPVRDFLLSTSVLDRVCASLGDALTGRSDGAVILNEIYRADLFLAPLDNARTWYRYHQLFQGILRHELARTAPSRVPALHRAAAEWFAAAGDLSQAVGHAMESADTELIGRLVAKGWLREFNAGHLQTVRAWLGALPHELVTRDARLSAARIWLALDGALFREARAALDAAEAHAGREVHLELLRSLLTFKEGDVGAARRLLDEIPRPAGEPFVATVHILLMGIAALWSGELYHADELLRMAAGEALLDDNRLARIYALGCLALVAVETGDVPAAERLLSEVAAEVEQTLTDAHFVAMFPALARARVASVAARWDVASAAAASAVDLARRGAGRIELAAALLTAAMVARAKLDTPTDRLAEARAVLAQCRDPGPVVRGWLGVEQRAGSTSQHRIGDEPLTERELTILRLLPGPMSQRELARALFVTPNTLKTHLRAIYRKLHADSRDSAVARARALRLI